MIVSGKQIIEFIKTGKNPYVEFGDPLDTLFSRVKKKPDEIIGVPNEFGYIYYKGVRFHHDENIINEFGIDFWHMKKKQKIKIKLPHFKETFILSKKTKVHEFLYLLNTFEIKWKMFGGTLGAPSIVYTAHVGISFDYYDGCIVKINTTDRYKSPLLDSDPKY